MENIEKNLQNFSTSRNMYRESVIFHKVNGKITGTLMYSPSLLISVESADVETSFSLNDFIIKGNNIEYVGTLPIPVLTDEEYIGKEGNKDDLEAMKRFHVKCPYYSESFIVKKQLLISYEYKEGFGNLFMQKCTELTEFKQKIQNKQPVTVVIYGDSIGQGMTSSKLMKRPPFVPTFHEMFCEWVAKKFDVSVTPVNVSEGGMATNWAVENMRERIPLNKDLYIFCWGMNDGTAGFSEQVYEENMKKLIEYTGGECILIAPMLPNPDAETTEGNKFLNMQPYYINALKRIETPSTPVFDLTNLHKELLMHKPYVDMTGNNINHPNDFLSRCIAIGIINFVFNE